MAKSNNFSDDELLIIQLVAISKLLVKKVVEVTGMTPEQVMIISVLEVTEQMQNKSESEVRSILDNARRAYAVGKRDGIRDRKSKNN